MIAIAFIAHSSFLYAQSSGSSNGANNPFVPNPPTSVAQRSSTFNVPQVIIKEAMSGPRDTAEPKFPNSTSKSNSAPVPTLDASPISRYSIGANDILEIKLYGAKGRHFQVSDDGTIDVPMASGTVFVAGKSTNEIEALIRNKISVVSATGVTVVVTDRTSHSIEVTGAVASPGIVHLQRDAVPLYVVCATVLPDASARFVKLARYDSGTATEVRVDLQKQPDFLVQPNDRLEFIGDSKAMVIGYYYIAGRTSKPGRQDLIDDLTLTNVIAFASLEKDPAKHVRLRSRMEDGSLKDVNLEVKLLRNGKIADVTISQGSIVEFHD